MAKPNTEAAIFLALLFDFSDVYVTNLPGLDYMSAAAWLAVDTGIIADAHKPDITDATGRTDVFGANN